MTQQNPFDPNFRSSFFAADPNLAFQTSLTQAGLPRSATDFFRRRTSDFLNQFQGAFGQRLAETGQADLNPLDFFQGQDFASQLQQFSPQQRGIDTRRFAPPTRFLFF